MNAGARVRQRCHLHVLHTRGRQPMRRDVRRATARRLFKRYAYNAMCTTPSTTSTSNPAATHYTAAQRVCSTPALLAPPQSMRTYAPLPWGQALRASQRTACRSSQARRHRNRPRTCPRLVRLRQGGLQQPARPRLPLAAPC